MDPKPDEKIPQNSEQNEVDGSLNGPGKDANSEGDRKKNDPKQRNHEPQESFERRMRLVGIRLCRLQFHKKVEFGLAVLVILFTGWMAGEASCQRSAFQDSSKRELRAYLYISEFIDDSLYAKGVFDLAQDKAPDRIRFRISNSGQTPAYNVRVGGRVHITDKIPPDPIHLNTDSVVYTTPILPRDGVPIYCEFQREIVGDTLKTMFLFGKMAYQDTFGDSHFLTFCYQYILGKKIPGNIPRAERDEYYPTPPEYNREY